jgi:hypothetical protein
MTKEGRACADLDDSQASPGGQILQSPANQSRSALADLLLAVGTEHLSQQRCQ